MDVATVASVFGLFAAILAVSVSATLYWLQRGETQRRLRALTAVLEAPVLLRIGDFGA